MVESKIIKLYSFVWEPILSDSLTGHDIIEFAKNLPQLRNALSCCVCNQLLTNREILSPSKCREHFVCKGCRGKDRKDDKKCELCEDWDTFEEDETLKVIVKSYQDFCFYFLTHEEIVRLLEVKHEVDPSFDTFKLVDLVAEGCKGSSLHKQRKLSLEKGNRGVVAHPIGNRKSKKTVGPVVVKTNPLAPTNTTAGKDKVPDGRITNISHISSTDKGPKCTTPVLEKALPMPRKVYSPSPPKPAASAPEQLIMVSPISSGPTTPTTAGNIPTTSPTIFKIKVEPGFQGAARNLTDKFVNVGNEMDARKLPTSSRQAVSQDHVELPVPGPSQSPSRGHFPTTIAISSSSGPFNSFNSLPIKLTPSLLPSSSQGTTHIYQITHPGGMITRALSIRPQQLRLASNMTFQGRGGVPVPVRVFGGPVTSEGIRVSTSPATNTQMPSAFTNAMPRRKIIVTTTTNSDLQQRWPDPTKVLQFATGDLSRLPGFATSALRPSVVSVGGAAPGGTRFPSMNIRPVSGPLVRPINPNSSVSVGSSGTCVPTSLVANRTSEPGLPQSLAMQVSSPVSTAVGTMIRSEMATSSAHMLVPVSTPNSTASLATPKRKQEGCRCGNATPNPGKLTCIGQRCACYADGNACSDCKCKGCKNPYLPGSGGKKLLHGVRALLDPQTNQTVPIVGSVNTGPSTSAVLHSPTVTSSSIPSAVATVGTTSYGHIPGASGVSHPTPPIQLIPVRFGQSGTPQYIQITNAHALQQIPLILSGGHLQASSAGGITIQGVPVSSLASGIHQVAHIQQQRPTQINIKSERTSHDGT